VARRFTEANQGNIGVMFGKTVTAFSSIETSLSKLRVAR